MPSVRFNLKELDRIFDNSIEYSNGFFRGIEIDRVLFNKQIGKFIVDALGKYIDSRAKMNPQALHHIYEWNRVGDNSARLFSFSVRPSKSTIIFNGKLKQSKSISDTSKEPFKNKAEIMEGGISVSISPKESEMLVFDYDGETIFTDKTIIVKNPGGSEVVGSFAKVTDDFFNNYLTGSLLKPYLDDLKMANEFTEMFPVAAKRGNATNIGVRAGKEYLDVKGLVIE